MSSLALPYAAIPYYGDPAGAIKDTLVSTGPFVATRILFKVPGDYFYYPLSVLCGLNTDATVITRTPLAVMFDSSGNTIVQQATTGTIPASSAFAFAWNVNTGSGYSNGADNFDAPLPGQLLEPGASFGVQVNGQQPGDTVRVVCTVIKIPTGGTYKDAQAVSAVPTPMLV